MIDQLYRGPSRSGEHWDDKAFLTAECLLGACTEARVCRPLRISNLIIDYQFRDNTCCGDTCEPRAQPRSDCDDV